MNETMKALLNKDRSRCGICNKPYHDQTECNGNDVAAYIMKLEYHLEATLIRLDQTDSITALMAEIQDELNKARNKHAPMHSPHEGYAVILEELDELKEEVFKQTNARNKMKMRQEAVQIAAMGARFIIDVCEDKHETSSNTSL